MRRTLISLLLAAFLLAQAATAAAQNPVDDYRRSGTIDPCKYSDGQLRRGSGNLPPDVEQYAPGLADALNQGREGCGGDGTGQHRHAPGRGRARAPGRRLRRRRRRRGLAERPEAQIKAPPSPLAAQRSRLADISTPAVTSKPGGDVPGWVLPLLLVALAVAGFVAVVRLTGADASRLTRPLGAAFRDAGERSGDAAAGLWDRVRLGR